MSRLKPLRIESVRVLLNVVTLSLSKGLLPDRAIPQRFAVIRPTAHSGLDMLGMTYSKQASPKI